MLENLTTNIFYHTCTTISTLASLLWMFIIMTKSPKEMNEFKWSLFKLAFFELLFSLSLGIILFPDLLFPLPAVACFGVGSYFGQTGARISCFFTIFFGMCALTSLNDCCMARLLIITDRQGLLGRLHRHWALSIIVIVTTNLLMGGVLFMALFNTFQDPLDFIEQATLSPHYVSAEFYIHENITILSMDIHKSSFQQFLGIVVLGLAGIYCLNLSCTVLVIRELQRVRLLLPPQSYQSHRSWAVMLIAQNTYPIVIILPVVYTIVLFMLNGEEHLASPVYKHVISIGLALYPLFSFLVCMFFIKPYKRYLLSFCYSQSNLELTPKISPHMSNTTL